MKQKRDPEGRQRGLVRASSHPCTWVGRGVPSGLIKPFELDRRKQSEDSSIEPAGPSRSEVAAKSPGDGTAAAARAPANVAELPPACSSAPGGPEARVRGLFERESCALPRTDAFVRGSTSSVIDARLRLVPALNRKLSRPAATPRDPPAADGRPTRTGSEFGVRLRSHLQR